MPEYMSDEISENMSDRMPGRLPDRMPGGMSKYLPDRMPEYMPEYMLDRISEYTTYMSKYMSWHVMVGITRSRVIFFESGHPLFCFLEILIYQNASWRCCFNAWLSFWPGIAFGGVPLGFDSELTGRTFPYSDSGHS